MPFKKYKKFFWFLIFFIVLDDIVVIKTSKPMAIACQAVSQMVLRAETVCALMTAAVFVVKKHLEKYSANTTTISDSIDNSLSNAPTPYSKPLSIAQDFSAQHQSTESKSTLNLPTISTQQPQEEQKTYTLKNFNIKTLLTHEIQRQSSNGLTAPEQKNIVYQATKNPFADTAAVDTTFMNLSYNKPAMVNITTGPNCIRASYGNEHHQLYAQVSQVFRPEDPTPQELAEQQAWLRYHHDPVYRAQIEVQRTQEMRMLIKAAIDNAVVGKIAALKTFFATSLETPLNQDVNELRYWLAPLNFEHKHGRLSIEQKSSHEAMEPIVAYFKKHYGKSWYQELAKYIDVKEFHLLIDSVNYKGWEWAVNKIYSLFYSAFYLQWVNLAKKVTHNLYNQKIMQIINACGHEKFDSAQEIVNQLHDKNAQEIFDYFYCKKFDAYGISLNYANDPAWASLSVEAKHEIKNLKNGINFYNQYLALRAESNGCLPDIEKPHYTCGTGLLKDPNEFLPIPQCFNDSAEIKEGTCGQVKINSEVKIPSNCIPKDKRENLPKRTCNAVLQSLPPLAEEKSGQTESEIAKESDSSNDQSDAKKLQKYEEEAIASPEVENNAERVMGPENILDYEKLIKTIEHATHENKLKHFFENPVHGFKDLLDKIGGAKNIDAQIRLVEEIVKQLMQHDNLPVSEKFDDILVNINGYTIVVRGFVHEGIIKIGTMFIPQ